MIRVTIKGQLGHGLPRAFGSSVLFYAAFLNFVAVTTGMDNQADRQDFMQIPAQLVNAYFCTSVKARWLQ